MQYYLKDKLIPLINGEKPLDGLPVVECITSDEYKKRYEKTIHKKVLMRSLGHEEFCKADILRDCIIGTFLIPCKEGLLDKEIGFGYYLDKNRLIFINDHQDAERILKEICKMQILERTSAAQVFLEFLEYIIKDDVIFLQQYEGQLEEMEENMLNGDVESFHKKLAKRRRELLKLNAYYQQLVDLSSAIEENPNKLLSEEECRMFNFYSKRISRYFDTTRMLREYSMQLMEIYQSQIDARQNEIMKFLTVVTAVFMPLTLVAGWYGMNFINMPELNAKYGYFVIIIVSILIILIEIWYFKVKNWFK